jgi:hypothetical protein
MLRQPRRDEYTIWTAIAPDALFTVRTHATRRDYELLSQIHRALAENPQLTILAPEQVPVKR